MKNYPEGLTSKYELLECLASHDESETILACRKSDEKLFVVKIYFSESPLYSFNVPEDIKKIDHPYIPKFIEEYKDDDLRYEIREYIPGTPLDKLVHKKELSVNEIDDIVLRLCSILEHLHSGFTPIIHRDIKPQNIIVSDSGDVYLIDFGIARTRSAVPESSDTVICTTRDFSAPEQYGFMETDCRSDIYSLGQVMKWLYSGVTDDRNNIIAKCTAFDPSKRYDSVKKVRKALTGKSKIRKLIPAMIAAVAVIAGIIIVFSVISSRHQFKEPLIEEAVRLSLGVSDLRPLTQNALDHVETLYIVADKAYATSDEFYAAVDDWYSRGKDPRGNISTLEDCRMLPNLHQLCIVGETLTDLSPIASCRQLEKIEVKNNNISDIDVLGSLPELTYVGINSNPVTDISPLINAKKLRYLDICDVAISDPSVLSQLGDFEYLDIDNGTQSYKYLSDKTIKKLRLGFINTRDLDFLKNIKGLETVQLNFSAYELIQKLGDTDFEVIYEGINTPVHEQIYTKYDQTRRNDQ